MDIAFITITAMVVLIAAVMLLWPWMLRYFLQKYYNQSYQPEEIKPEQEQKFPDEHHLVHVPWKISPWQVCQSTSLQMIAASHGIDYPRPNFDFLMAFTYGASSLPAQGFSPFGTDPEIGLLTAAPYLELKRIYRVTHNPVLFVKSLRATLAGGEPVRLAVDQGTLYGKAELIAHSIVLVGYDPDGFYFYETVGLPPSPVAAGEFPPGEKGLYIKAEILISAVERLARHFKYPWRYAYTFFEPAPLQEDLRPAWLQAGRAMADEIKYGPRMGSRVIEDLAARIEREGIKFDLTRAQPGVALAARLREDNAGFLRANFWMHADVLEAAGQLEHAAHNYRLALQDMEDGIADQNEARRIALRLFDAAAAERNTGEIFLKRGNEQV